MLDSARGAKGVRDFLCKNNAALVPRYCMSLLSVKRFLLENFVSDNGPVLYTNAS